MSDRLHDCDCPATNDPPDECVCEGWEGSTADTPEGGWPANHPSVVASAKLMEASACAAQHAGVDRTLGSGGGIIETTAASPCRDNGETLRLNDLIRVGAAVSAA